MTGLLGPGWYLRRLSAMGPVEIAGRAGDVVRKRRWRALAGTQHGTPWLPRREFTATLDRSALEAVPRAGRERLLATAERVLDGRADYFGVTRDDLVSPDWSYDPRTGRRAPSETYAFDVPYRDEAVIGDVKQIWEPSRHQHLTVLAAAYAVTGDDRYANRVAEHLKSWWAANPPLRGVHWVSGIELGIRLISWVWVRRLLDGWRGAPGLFEENPEALHQVRFHQCWLAAFGSRGSSANNHAVAEAAGQLAAACAFAWFPESADWRATAMRTLDRHLRANTFPSGLNRELATEYHGLVLELGLAALAEATTVSTPVPDSTWQVLLRMTDALASIVDAGSGPLRPPRQGDADDGHGLVLDGAGSDRWDSLLCTGKALFGGLDWWPAVAGGDVRTTLLASLVRPCPQVRATRPARRPGHFADAGMTILRGSKVWCRCDGGPHGFLSIAAHAHADALSVEVRHEGVDILADPGTYCYHGEPRWRSYFRSTLAHNTLDVSGVDQSVSGGPFLWTRHARSRVLVAHTPDEGNVRWSAEHDGYRPAVHRRTVELDGDRELWIVDEVRDGAERPCRLAFHLGPDVTANLDGHVALLAWLTHDGSGREAVLDLPAGLTWSAHRGETDPPLGWYSPGFGRKVPAWSLIGSGTTGEGPLETVLRFRDPPGGG